MAGGAVRGRGDRQRSRRGGDGRGRKVIALMWVVAALYFVVRDGPPPGSHVGWGWCVALVGALGMVAAAIGSIVARLRGGPESRWVRQPFSWRRAIGGGVLDRPVAAGVADLLAGDVHHRATAAGRRPPTRSPPIGAQAATEAFTSGSPRPRDLDLEYAWSTAATVEPFAEGAKFYPRIFDDIQNATKSVHILMFGWDSNEIGTEFADVLKHKLAEGVEVRIARRRPGLRSRRQEQGHVQRPRARRRRGGRQRHDPARLRRALRRIAGSTGGRTSSGAPSTASCT